MQTKLLSSPSPAKTQSAFTFVEVIIAMAAVGVVVVALYMGISSGFSIIRLARENLRATQIMVEKMETVRLYNWDQICSNGFIPSPFQAPYYSQGLVTNPPIYYGTVSLDTAPISPDYSNDLKRIVVNISWTSGDVPRQRQITTFVSRYGLQNYIY